ncbi:kinase A anchor protein [Amanita rubescens]|nr:kinase A anchor protein [Amanita rubescens]
MRTRRCAKFQKDLLEAKVAGVDESIFMAPNRLHITLGIMTLGGSSAKTVETALDLLQALQPSIADLLQDKNSVKVKLNSLEILKQDKEATQVLVIGTPDDDDGKRLKAVCELIHKVFIEAGYIAPPEWPLKIHCTVIKTVPQTKYSYADIQTVASDKVPTDGFGEYEVQQIELWKKGYAGSDGAVSLTKVVTKVE